MSTIQLKRSSVASKVPLTSDLALGELAMNTNDGLLFFKKDPGTPSIVTLVTTDATQTLTNKTLSGLTLSGSLTANGSTGSAGQVLTSNSTGTYWSTPSASGATNLTLSSNGSTVTVLSDTGTDAIILAANATTAGVLTAEAQTIGGAKTFSENTSISGVLAITRHTEAVTTATVSTLTYNIDLSLSNVFNLTLSSNTVFTFTNPPASGVLRPVTVILTQDATGGRTSSFNNVRYTDGTAPQLTTTANAVDVLTFFTINGGSWYFGTFAMAAVS